MAAKPVTPVSSGQAVPVPMVENRFHGPLSKLYEGPMNDIRHKLIEEGWYGRQVTGDFREPTLSPQPNAPAGPEPSTKPEPGIHSTGPTIIEADFRAVYGEPLNPVEAPKIEAPKVEPPRIEGPRIDP